MAKSNNPNNPNNKKNTKHIQDQINKKIMGEELDYLRQVDTLPTEEGRKFVIEKEEEKVKKDEDLHNDVKNSLQSQAIYTYRHRLAVYGQTALESLDFPDGWEKHSIATDGRNINIFGKWFKSKEGILIIVKSPKGDVFVRGIFCTMNPDYDIKAIDILILQAENTLDSYKGLLISDGVDTVSGLKKTKGGIILPN